MEVYSPKLIVGKEGKLEGWNEVEEGGCQQHLPRELALVLHRILHCLSSAVLVESMEVGLRHHVRSVCYWVLSRLKVLIFPETKS